MAGINGGTINAYLELDTGKYNAAMAAATSQLGILQDHNAGVVAKLGGLGKAMQTVGSQLTLGLTLPILGAGIAAGKAAMDFESAFAGVRKTVDATETEYAELAEGLKTMSERLPESANNLAAIMEIAGQLGVDKDNLLAFTETIANLGVSTNLTGEEAATMLAQYANITGMDLKDIERLGSVIVDLGNNCATTEKDIAEMAHRLAGTGSLLGLTDAQIMGLAATMSALGINAEAGGSAMSRTLQKMNTAVLAGGEMLDAYAATAGVSAERFAAAWSNDPIQALDMFLQGLARVKMAGVDTSDVLKDLGLNDIRVTDTLLRLSGAQGQLAANVQLARDAWEANIALQNEADKRYGTTESKIKLAQNAIQNAAADIGEALLPVVAQVMEAVAGAAKWFEALDEDIQGTILVVAGLVAAVGPLMTVLGTVVSILSNPVGLVAALGLAGAAAVTYFTQADRAATRARLAERFGKISLSAQEMDDAIRQLVRSPMEGLEQWGTYAADAASAMEQMHGSTEKLDKLLIRAEMGLEVDKKSLKEAVVTVRKDTKAAIEAERVNAQVLVNAVFGKDSEDGKVLAGKFNDYFSGLNAEASKVGRELSRAVEKAMADGFMDANEQETIEALRLKLQRLQNQAATIEQKGALLQLSTEARNVELTPESLMGLSERFSALIQEQTDKVLGVGGAKEMLVTMTYNVAAAANWSEDELYQALVSIDREVENTMHSWQADVMTDFWKSTGSRVVRGFEAEISQAENMIPQALEKAKQWTKTWADQMGYELNDPAVTSRYADSIRQAIGDLNWSDVISSDTRKEAQMMYQSLIPTHETLAAMSGVMRDAFPQALQEALNQLNFLQAISMSGIELGNALVFSLSEENVNTNGMGILLGKKLGQESVEGAKSEEGNMREAGRQSAEGFAGGVRSGEGAAAAAGRSLGRAAQRGARAEMQINSPSRVMRGLGVYGSQGFVQGLLDGQRQAFRAGYTLGDGAIQGVAAGQDSHSPSRKAKLMGKYLVEGYKQGIAGQNVYDYAEKMVNKELERIQRNSRNAARAAAATAMTAEAHRQQTVMDSIVSFGERMIRADQEVADRRMAQLAASTQAMMAFAGAHSVWYQPNKGETGEDAVKAYYDNAIALVEKNRDAYDAYLTGTGASDETKQKAKADADARIKALKEQQAAEIAAIRAQYQLQKDMATDWLNVQKEQLQQAFDARRKAYEEDDYQEELAALKKKQRQSKSARERRELQAQIDKMERNHALDQEEEMLQITLDGYDQLIDAVRKGLIGLGDLTGNGAFGTLSFGTAGLAGIDTLTGKTLQAVMASLSAASLQHATGTATAQQLASALQSAGQRPGPWADAQARGNTYQIDLRGAVIRDQSDITAIVDQLEKRMRQAGR